MNIFNLTARIARHKNESLLIVTSFLMNLGLEASYFVGFLGYAAYGFGAGPALIASVMLVINIAFMAGSVAAGVIIDRIGPRKTACIASIILMIVCIIGQLCTESTFAFMGFAAFFGFFSMIQRTSADMFAPYLSREKEGIARINSRITMGLFAATIIGPALGGLVIMAFPIPRVFLLTSLASALSAAVVLGAREVYSPHENAESAQEKTSPLREMAKGWQLIRSIRSLRFYLLAGIAIWFSFGAFDALESLYYKEVLLVGPEWLAWMNSIVGVALVLGAFALARLPLRYISTFLMTLTMLVVGLGTVLYVATTSVFWSATGIFILGIAVGIYHPLSRTLIQADSPLEASGRVVGTVDMFSRGATLLPLAITPFIARFFSVQAILVGAGVITTLMGAAFVLPSRKLDKETALSRHLEGEHVNPFE